MGSQCTPQTQEPEGEWQEHNMYTFKRISSFLGHNLWMLGAGNPVQSGLVLWAWPWQMNSWWTKSWHLVQWLKAICQGWLSVPVKGHGVGFCCHLIYPPPPQKLIFMNLSLPAGPGTLVLRSFWIHSELSTISCGNYCCLPGLTWRDQSICPFSRILGRDCLLLCV